MTTTSSGTGAASEAAPVPVVSLQERNRSGLRPPALDPLTLAAAIVATALAFSPLTSGYYAFTSWAPLAIGLIVLLVVLALVVRPRLTRTAVVASLGLLSLLALSFASILWAQSRDSAWTSANQLALYCVIFAIGLLAIRRRRSAQVVLLILGLPALLTSLVLAVVLVSGGGGSAYLLGRLDQPIGYVNATAGLLAMGIWPWLALAEAGRTRRIRVLALAGASVIAAIAVTTQARALIPAFVVTTALVILAAPGRTRRALQLTIVIVAILASSHWTLAIYSSTGPIQQYMPSSAALRHAGLAIIGSGLLAGALLLALELIAARVSAIRSAEISRRTGQGMLAALAAAAVVIGVAAHGTISTQWRDFTHLNPEQSAPNRFVAIGSGFRYDLWRVALDEFKGDPVAGVGAGNYDDSYYRLRQNPQSVTVPHSLEMQVLAELGLLGLIALGLFCGGVLRAGLGADGRTLAGQDPGIRIAALGVFAAWLTATSFDWLYNIPGLTGMAVLAAAILLVRAPDAYTPTEEPRNSRPSLRRQVSLAAALGVLALLAAGLGRQYAATLYSDSGQRLVSKNPVKALGKLRTAEELNPWSMQTQYRAASAYARLDDYAAARTVLLHAEQLEPDNYVPPALLGDIATRAGDETTALAAYRRALRLDPHEPTLAAAVKTAEAAAQ
jgi:hypothetical protein